MTREHVFVSRPSRIELTLESLKRSGIWIQRLGDSESLSLRVIGESEYIMYYLSSNFSVALLGWLGG